MGKAKATDSKETMKAKAAQKAMKVMKRNTKKKKEEELEEDTLTFTRKELQKAIKDAMFWTIQRSESQCDYEGHYIADEIFEDFPNRDIRYT